MAHDLARAVLEFASSDLAPEELRQRAGLLLDSEELPRNVLGLTSENQTKLVDRVYETFPTVDSQNAKSVTALGRVCSATGKLPTSTILCSQLNKHGNFAVGSGGIGDIWRGHWGAKVVAIKALRIHPAKNLKNAKQILWERVPMWKRLSHENIIPFHGINTTLFQLALVYDWGQNGNIIQYLMLHPRASRPSLLLDVVKGLEYLHSLDIPHGDLKGANIIIDQDGRARLTEYDLSLINSGPSFTLVAALDAFGTSRWAAPELINPSRKGDKMSTTESKSADVFTYAMVSVEVFTGKVPFEGEEDEDVVLRILKGGRPEMPQNAKDVGLTAELWRLIEDCWQQNPKKRPTISAVVGRWGRFIESNQASQATPPQPPNPNSSASDARAQLTRLNNETTHKRKWLFGCL